MEQSKNQIYQETMQALISYIKTNETNPNEKKWNRIAIEKGLLSSKSMGYLEGIGFNKLCKKLRKEIKNGMQKGINGK